MKKLNALNAMSLLAACALSLPAAAQITFTGETTGFKTQGYTVGGVSFFNTVLTDGTGLEVQDFGSQSIGNAIAAYTDSNGAALRMTFAATNSISLDFGNDDPFFTNPGDLAYLQVFSGNVLVGTSSVLLNRNDDMDQTISFSGASFDSAIFAYVGSSLTPFTGGGNTSIGLTEVVDNIQISAIPEPETYAMMLAGLGLLGFVARRRKQHAA